MLRFQRCEAFIEKLVQLLVVLGGVGLEFAAEVGRDLEIERHRPGRFRLFGLALRPLYASGFSNLRHTILAFLARHRTSDAIAQKCSGAT